MKAFIIVVSGRGLRDRVLTRGEYGTRMGLDNPILYSAGMATMVLAIWRAKANCSHLTFEAFQA